MKKILSNAEKSTQQQPSKNVSENIRTGIIWNREDTALSASLVQCGFASLSRHDFLSLFPTSS